MAARKRYDGDVRKLRPRDEVEVYLEAARSWTPGVFDISSAGVAYVELSNGVIIGLANAMLTGLRRVERHRQRRAARASTAPAERRMQRARSRGAPPTGLQTT